MSSRVFNRVAGGVWLVLWSAHLLAFVFAVGRIGVGAGWLDVARNLGLAILPSAGVAIGVAAVRCNVAQRHGRFVLSARVLVMVTALITLLALLYFATAGDQARALGVASLGVVFCTANLVGEGLMARSRPATV